MKNSNRLAQNYSIRRGLFYLLAPLVGVGSYIINSQKNHARTNEPRPHVLVSLNAIQVKNLVTESTPDITKGKNTASYYDGLPQGPKPGGNT